MEESVFIQQVNLCQGMMIKLIGLYAYSVEDRNDLYQEILLNAWKGVNHFRHEAKFSTWLYQVALNTLLTFNRKKKPLIYHDAMEDFIIPVAPQTDSREEIQQLYTAIRQLTKTDRALIILHLEGYDNQEIAAMIGIKPNYVGVKLFRIKNQLQTLLQTV
ncbi:RNA polymerase sigma factor [Mucilaginibacter terrae]|uniref:RNA polymerase sigma factor n=1 Tax=Mucilaginibacter terrae TaxID=1955052 RepID=UPI00363DECAE